MVKNKNWSHEHHSRTPYEERTKTQMCLLQPLNDINKTTSISIPKLNRRKKFVFKPNISKRYLKNSKLHFLIFFLKKINLNDQI